MWSDVGLDDNGKGLSSRAFTRSNIETPNLQPYDRPYGAWLYGVYHLARVKLTSDPRHPNSFDAKTADSIEVDAGMLGPGAAGKYFQNTAHKILASPAVWDPA